MAHHKTQVKWSIDKKAIPRRSMTFTKSRVRLVRKARELAVLCDAQVALIIFSSSGTLYEYASPSMKSILETYCSSSQGDRTTRISPTNNKPRSNIPKEMKRLKRQQRQMKVQETRALSIEDLQKLETKFALGLSKVRLQKERLMSQYIEDVARKEHKLSTEYDKLGSQENEGHASGFGQGEGFFFSEPGSQALTSP